MDLGVKGDPVTYVEQSKQGNPGEDCPPQKFTHKGDRGFLIRD